MYSTKPSVVYGFHGIDREAAIRILNQEDNFLHSNNSYDWLGQGIYFWENNYQIRFAHQLAKEKGTYFDSVRAAFLEGEPLYPDSMFRKQNHIQIAVVNPNCIKGIFLPREQVPFP